MTTVLLDSTRLGLATELGVSGQPRAQVAASLEERAMGGDAAAWNALVERHNHRVLVSLLARGVRVDRAKDLAQDAWLRLVEQQREGKLTHLILPGLAVTQAGFLAREEARQARRVRSEGDAEAAAIVDPSVDAETKLLADEQLARAARVLSACSPSARRVFQLVYGGSGLSHGQVAARVGLSLQRVRQIVCEVRQRLRAAIDVEEGGER